MKSNITQEKIFVGVDVSKATLDVYRPDTKEAFQIENSDEAIAVLCSQLEKKKRKVMVIVGWMQNRSNRCQSHLEVSS